MKFKIYKNVINKKELEYIDKDKVWLQTWL